MPEGSAHLFNLKCVMAYFGAGKFIELPITRTRWRWRRLCMVWIWVMILILCCIRERIDQPKQNKIDMFFAWLEKTIVFVDIKMSRIWTETKWAARFICYFTVISSPSYCHSSKSVDYSVPFINEFFKQIKLFEPIYCRDELARRMMFATQNKATLKFSSTKSCHRIWFKGRRM